MGARPLIMAKELARKAQSPFNSAISSVSSCPITDSVYSDAQEETEKLSTNVESLHRHLKQLSSCLQALAKAQQLVAEDFAKLYECADESPSEAHIVKDYNRVTEGLSNDIPTRMLPALQSSAIEPAGEWCAKLDAVLLQSASEPVLDAFKKFRHYEDKLQDMTKSGAKTQSRDVYERNVEKRDNAEEIWTGIKEELISGMNAMTSVAADESNKILLRVIQFTQAFHKQSADLVNTLTGARNLAEQLVKSPPVRSPQAVAAPQSEVNDELLLALGGGGVAPSGQVGQAANSQYGALQPMQQPPMQQPPTQQPIHQQSWTVPSPRSSARQQQHGAPTQPTANKPLAQPAQPFAQPAQPFAQPAQPFAQNAGPFQQQSPGPFQQQQFQQNAAPKPNQGLSSPFGNNAGW